MSLRIAHVASIDLSFRVLLLTQLRCLIEAGYEVTAISAPGPWVGHLESAGIRHVPWLGVTRSWDVQADAKAFFELWRIIRRGGFDLVHTHNAKPGVMGRVAARFSGVPCVVNTVHGFDARPDDRLMKRSVYMGLEGLAARFSHLELFQSNEDLVRATRSRVTVPSRAAHLGNGIALDRFDPSSISGERLRVLRAELGLPEGALIVGTVGRLVADKGYRELLEAARRVCQARDDVHFLVIGDSDPVKSDALNAEEIDRARSYCVFTGWREDMPDLLALMDVFVLASWREGMPRAAMEAAAMARPMVLTDIPGCREIARHGDQALFVSPRSPDALVDAISTLVDDPGLRAALGARARATALRRFDESAVAEKILDHYAQLFQKSGFPVGSAADEVPFSV